MIVAECMCAEKLGKVYFPYFFMPLITTEHMGAGGVNSQTHVRTHADLAPHCELFSREAQLQAPRGFLRHVVTHQTLCQLEDLLPSRIRIGADVVRADSFCFVSVRWTHADIAFHTEEISWHTYI